MSMSSDITLGTDLFSTIVVKPRSTIRSNPAQLASEPETLTISHEVASNGRISSVFIIDDGTMVPCNDACATTPTMSNVRGMIKLQYNPNEGNTDIDISVAAVIEYLKALLADDALMTKFRNQEH